LRDPERALEIAKIERVAGAVGEADVERSARLPHRIVVLLVHRKRVDGGVRFEDERRAVALMDVEIDDGDACDAFGLKDACGDGDVVEGAESFAVIRKGMVETTADVRHDRPGR